MVNVTTESFRVHFVFNELGGQPNFLGAMVKAPNGISTHYRQKVPRDNMRTLPVFFAPENLLTSYHHSKQSDSKCWEKYSFV